MRFTLCRKNVKSRFFFLFGIACIGLTVYLVPLDEFDTRSERVWTIVWWERASYSCMKLVGYRQIIE